MDTLQRNGYDLAKAMSTLVPQGGPVLCRDEMEEWSASEAMLFEEALEKYGKDFNDIRQDFVSGWGSGRQVRAPGPGARCELTLVPSAPLSCPGSPWPASSSSITCGKPQTATFSRYGLGRRRAGGLLLRCSLTLICPPFLQKRLKAAEADSKLKQVYIPT